MKIGKKVHFIGIGGVSMSALAQLLQAQEVIVSGSDINKVALKNIDTNSKNVEENIKNCDSVVVSCAIKENDNNVLLAKKYNKPIITRGELLGQIAGQYDCTISVAGTHGKTSTTEMLAEVLMMANKNPTVHIGGMSNKFHSNLLIGKKDFFVTEACEYCNSFLSLNSTVGVILNTEPEHLDFFGTFENMQKSFLQFAKQSNVVVANVKAKIPNAITFGTGGNFEAKNIKKTKDGFCFDVSKNKKFLGKKFELNSINKKNIENALAVVAVCDVLKIDMRFVKTALKNFCGVERRCQKLSGENPLVFADYAHHPTEIKNIILSFKKFYQKQVVVFFQPHTFSRTKLLFDDFLKSLSFANEIVLFPTFSAREKESDGLGAKDLFLKLKEQNKNVECFDKLKNIKNIILKHKNYQNKIILILGAGDLIKYYK